MVLLLSGLFFVTNKQTNTFKNTLSWKPWYKRRQGGHLTVMLIILILHFYCFITTPEPDQTHVPQKFTGTEKKTNKHKKKQKPHHHLPNNYKKNRAFFLELQRGPKFILKCFSSDAVVRQKYCYFRELISEVSIKNVRATKFLFFFF